MVTARSRRGPAVHGSDDGGPGRSAFELVLILVFMACVLVTGMVVVALRLPTLTAP